MSEQQDRWSAFAGELKRRRVVRVALAYAAAAFVLLQAAQLVFDAFDVSDSAFRTLVVAVLAGFPVVLLLGWLFDLTSEGLVLTAARREGRARMVARVKPAVFVGGGVLALLGTVALAVMVGMPRSAASAVVAPGADLIAVLPFSSSGAGVKELEQGMVELLSRNLSEVGSIRTVDPRLVLSRWEARARGGPLALDEAMALARETYAGSFLTGSVVQAGASVRLSADLYALDGSRVASAHVDGPAGEVLSLVDSLSLALLRDVWQSSRPLPRLDVGAITSNDLGAIRAFLAGERHYRASAWDAAMEAFGRAVAADSTFALAHYRLALASSWAGAGEQGRRSADAAARLLDRLPQREQTLVRAEALRRSGDRAAATDTMSAYLERYADDAEAWFLLADDVFHLQDERAGPTGDPVDRQLWMFDRALELDPTYAPALIHPLEVAFRAANTALAKRYVDLVAATPAADSAGVAVYRAALEALRDPASPAKLAAALARASVDPPSSVVNLYGQAAKAVTHPLLRAAASLPARERQAVAQALEPELRRRVTEHPPEAAAAHLMIASGRLADGRRLLERARAARAADRLVLQRLALLPLLAGTGDTTSLVRTGPLALDPGLQAVGEALAAIDRGDAAGVRRAAGRIRGGAKAADHDSVLYRRLAGAAEAFVPVLEGKADGLERLERVLKEGGFVAGDWLEPFWFRWLERLAESPEERGRAITLLAAPWPGEAAFELPRLYVLGRARAAAGDAAGAREAYARFVAAASDTDRASRLRPRVDAANQALARLGRAGS